MATQYTPSGRYSPLSFVLFAVTLVTAIPLLATAYAYAIWYVPFVFLNVIITVFFGIGTSYVVNTLVVKLGKVRRNSLATKFSLMGALAALYVHWAVWVDLVINNASTGGLTGIGIPNSSTNPWHVLVLVLFPGPLFGLAGVINETGTWSIKGIVPSGIPLLLIWLVEAVIIVAIPMVLSTMASRKPFCETTRRWFKEVELPAYRVIDDVAAFRASLEILDVSPLAGMTRADSTEGDHCVVTRYTAPQSPHCYLTVRNKRARLNDKGETVFDEEVLADLVRARGINKGVVMG